MRSTLPLLTCIALSLLIATDGRVLKGKSLRRHSKREPSLGMEMRKQSVLKDLKQHFKRRSGIAKREETAMLLNEVRKLNWFMCMNTGFDVKECNHGNPGIKWPEVFKFRMLQRFGK